MELKYFKLIKTIAEEGNIVNSSQRLFLTQSALSHQLKDLEGQLGFKVFYRKRNEWKLTEEGELLNKLGAELISKMENGFEHIEQLRKGALGKIKVSTECYSFYHGLPAFIEKMAVFYPNIDVDLILEATHQPISKVLSKEIDIALVTKKIDNETLGYRPIFSDEIYAIMHRENPLAKREFLNADDFIESHLIIHSFPMETVSVYQNFLRPQGVMPVKITAIPLTEVALEMVNSNMGLACFPKWAIMDFHVSKDLVLKKLGKNGLKRIHYLVYREEDLKKKYINDFILNFEDDFGARLT